MKKRFTIQVVIILICSFFQIPSFAAEQPKVESLVVNPVEIDVQDPVTDINIKVTVSHPSGISNVMVGGTLKDSKGNSYGVNLKRTDFPIIQSLQNVVFVGKISIPRTAIPGAYNLTIDSLSNNSSAGYIYETGQTAVKNLNNIPGLENSILIRENGFLNLSDATFFGPTFNLPSGQVFKDLIKYNLNIVPEWRVGEIFDPSKYFELQVSDGKIEISSQSPQVCSSNGAQLKFLTVGTCTYTVFTEKTKNYLKYIKTFVAIINSAKTKPILIVNPVSNQTSENLPKDISLSQVYSVPDGYLLPISMTENVCFANGYTVKIISGGICKLKYQTTENSTYLPSDPVYQVFEITRNTQTLKFEVAINAKVGSKPISLDAISSSGGPVTFTASPINVCQATGKLLRFNGKGTCQVSASQLGTTTFAPVSVTKSISVLAASVIKKSIVCIRGSKEIKTTASKCPKGYKKK